ncbi:MAG: Holliday junction DNA helicase RuvA [Omnitrophica bacterium RIFCSPHIGHO2_02_FULL_51_18]|nr:MAG: Holliday junction DNA helicase RuvA [Omnitrophica bacterium RIFCSPHIGHO2_02_FULL_51_18]
MRILALDFGEKRIGAAVSDPLGFTAQGLETIENKGKQNVFQALKELCRETNAEEMVIGLPVNMNGTVGPKAKQVLDLVPELQKELGIPVSTWDERLSSRQALRLMIEEGLSRVKQKKQSDQLAAMIILQGYLESKRPKK